MKSKKLPPHTWEAHPIADKGEIRKPFLIAVITIVAVIALVGLLFVGKQFVGKAIEMPVNNAGISVESPVTVWESMFEAYS